MTNKNIVPYHLGIIIDGNRRWAKKRGLSPFLGHKKGFNNIIKIGECCFKKGVKIITIYCFSVENWNRSKEEVNYLMKLLKIGLEKYFQKCVKNNIVFRVMGQKEKLSNLLQEKIKKMEAQTKNNKKGVLNLAISYGGRDEIIEVIKKIIKAKTPSEKITKELINKNLWTNDLPDPDLIVRTGGEQRLSNFLTWQSVYSEFYFTDKYWPDFTVKDLEAAFKNYSKRQRRFGK